MGISAVTLQGWFKETLRIERLFEKRGKLAIFLATANDGEELLKHTGLVGIAMKLEKLDRNVAATCRL